MEDEPRKSDDFTAMARALIANARRLAGDPPMVKAWKGRMLALCNEEAEPRADLAAALPDDAFLSAVELAKAFSLKVQTARHRLDALREPLRGRASIEEGTDWCRLPAPKERAARILYRVGAVRKALEEVKPRRPR